MTPLTQHAGATDSKINGSTSPLSRETRRVDRPVSQLKNQRTGFTVIHEGSIRFRGTFEWLSVNEVNENRFDIKDGHFVTVWCHVWC